MQCFGYLLVTCEQLRSAILDLIEFGLVCVEKNSNKTFMDSAIYINSKIYDRYYHKQHNQSTSKLRYMGRFNVSYKLSQAAARDIIFAPRYLEQSTEYVTLAEYSDKKEHNKEKPPLLGKHKSKKLVKN